MGVCVPNFRSVSFFVRPGDVTHINTHLHTYTNIRVNLRISSTGCSPQVDFDKYINKAIEEVCGKPTSHGSFSRLAAVKGIFSKKQKILCEIRSMGVCVPNFRSVSLLV